MKTSFRVPLWRIFLNWAIAVIAGSIIWPLAASMFKEGPSIHSDDVFGLMVISAIMSGLTSIPAILLLLLTTWKLNGMNVSKGTYRFIHSTVHLTLGFLTFGVIFVFAELSNSEFFIFLLLAASYIAAGIISWAITFVIYDRKSKEISPTSEELLDGGV